MSSILTNFESQSTNKSVILSTMSEEAPTIFLNWFNLQLENKNLGVTAAADFIGVSHPTISLIITNHKKPSCETCFKIADAFKINREFVLRLAGWLQPISDSEEIIRQTLSEMNMTSDQGKRLILRLAQGVREEEESYRAG